MMKILLFKGRPLYPSATAPPPPNQILMEQISIKINKLNMKQFLEKLLNH